MCDARCVKAEMLNQQILLLEAILTSLVVSLLWLIVLNACMLTNFWAYNKSVRTCHLYLQVQYTLMWFTAPVLSGRVKTSQVKHILLYIILLIFVPWTFKLLNTDMGDK